MEPLVRGAAELGIRLDQAQIEQFRRCHSELVDWNRRINLTAVTDWAHVQTRHFLDSLAVSTVLPPDTLRSGGSVLDVGSGAGFPGLPLKIAFPCLRLTLLDATAKKTAFLSHLAQELGLEDVEVLTGRAETLAHDPALRESFDVVVSRAVAKLPVLAELTLGFCRIGGVVVAQKSAGVADEVREALVAVAELGGRLGEVRPVTMDMADGDGALVVLEKASPTPKTYPRRPGIPAKRPL